MDVILLQDVETLGGKGALVGVARGYARNFLIPQKLAEVATPGKIVEFQRREEERKARDVRLAAQADEHTATLNKTVLTLSAKVGDGDRLFGSITAVDVADAIKASRGFSIDKRKVRLEEPIKEVGTFMVEVEVGDGFVATVKVIVTPE
jgi:large subunit ribosomal protein L9